MRTHYNNSNHNDKGILIDRLKDQSQTQKEWLDFKWKNAQKENQIEKEL